MSRANLRDVVRMLDFPEMDTFHVSVAALGRFADADVARFARAFEHSRANTRRRRELVDAIERTRRISETIAISYEVSIRTIVRLVNQIRPKNVRMSERQLEKELASISSNLRSAVNERVGLLLHKAYENAQEDELAQYLKLLQSESFRWFIDKELAAFSTMVTVRFSGAESELLSLFEDTQREALGVQERPSLEGMTPARAIETLIESYGKKTLIEVILQKRSGQISIAIGGLIRSKYGRPREDLVTTASIIADLGKLNLDMDSFANTIDSYLVNSGFSDRRRTVSGRQFPAAGGAPTGVAAARAGRQCRTGCTQKRELCRAQAQARYATCVYALQGSPAKRKSGECATMFRARGQGCATNHGACVAGC